jgi:hypothetical protein
MPQKKYVHNSVSSAGITQIRFKGYLLSLVGTPAQLLYIKLPLPQFFYKIKEKFKTVAKGLNGMIRRQAPDNFPHCALRNPTLDPSTRRTRSGSIRLYPFFYGHVLKKDKSH